MEWWLAVRNQIEKLFPIPLHPVYLLWTYHWKNLRLQSEKPAPTVLNYAAAVLSTVIPFIFNMKHKEALLWKKFVNESYKKFSVCSTNLTFAWQGRHLYVSTLQSTDNIRPVTLIRSTVNGNMSDFFIAIASGYHCIQLTVHLWGFSPVWRRMWTTSIYWALNGFSSREQSTQRQTNDFLFAWMWSLLMCCGMNKWTICYLVLCTLANIPKRKHYWALNLSISSKGKCKVASLDVLKWNSPNHPTV